MTGDDDGDDPAWGTAPVWVGSARNAASWLRASSSIDRYSVSEPNGIPIWAANFLHMVPDVPVSRAEAIRHILEEQLTFAATYPAPFDIDEAVRRILVVVNEPEQPNGQPDHL